MEIKKSIAQQCADIANQKTRVKLLARECADFVNRKKKEKSSIQEEDSLDNDEEEAHDYTFDDDNFSIDELQRGYFGDDDNDERSFGDSGYYDDSYYDDDLGFDGNSNYRSNHDNEYETRKQNDDWDLYQDLGGNYYYHNEFTGQSVWACGENNNWTLYQDDESGYYYYHNAQTGQSVWATEHETELENNGTFENIHLPDNNTLFENEETLGEYLDGYEERETSHVPSTEYGSTWNIQSDHPTEYKDNTNYLDPNTLDANFQRMIDTPESRIASQREIKHLEWKERTFNSKITKENHNNVQPFSVMGWLSSLISRPEVDSDQDLSSDFSDDSSLSRYVDTNYESLIENGLVRVREPDQFDTIYDAIDDIEAPNVNLTMVDLFKSIEPVAGLSIELYNEWVSTSWHKIRNLFVNKFSFQ